MTSADEIWNRAATQGGGRSPRPGDVALAAVLALHNLTMSGGLVDAVERLASSELDAAELGYRWLGLDAAGQLITHVRAEIGNGALDEDERAESLELLADQEDAQAIPLDRTLVDAFEARFPADPAAFART